MAGQQQDQGEWKSRLHFLELLISLVFDCRIFGLLPLGGSLLLLLLCSLRLLLGFLNGTFLRFLLSFLFLLFLFLLRRHGLHEQQVNKPWICLAPHNVR